MLTRKPAIVVMAFAALAAALEPVVATAQPPSPAALLEALEPPLRERARALLAEADDARRARLANELATNAPSALVPFLSAVAETDASSAVRAAVIGRLGRDPSPEAVRMLERRAAADPDAGVALLALERLRFERMRELRLLLARRIEEARRSGDAQAQRALAEEDERWLSLTRGTMLPRFLRATPPHFSLKPADRGVRVLAFGDFGDGGEAQRQLAKAMLRFHRKSAFDFGITLGDNFYDRGLPSPNDGRWKTWWHDMYGPLRLRFWATLGNHDWGDPDSPAAEILHTRQSESWRLPAPYYTYSAGPVQFFALDTNEMSEAQLTWMDAALSSSRSRWRIVYGHHPIYSAGVHRDNEALRARLLPLLRNRADVYLAGHDHDLQHLAPDGGVHFFVSGCGGKSLRPPTPKPNSLFATAVLAFTVIEADGNRLRIDYFDTRLERLYSYSLSVPNARPAATAEGHP